MNLILYLHLIHFKGHWCLGIGVYSLHQLLFFNNIVVQSRFLSISKSDGKPTRCFATRFALVILIIIILPYLKICPHDYKKTLQPIHTKLSEGVEGDSKGCNQLFKFSRWPPFPRWPPLKISADVSDLSDPYCDWNENWYSDTVD